MGNSYQTVNLSYGFNTPNQKPDFNSIWSFFVQDVPPRQPLPPPPPECRFWQLEPYLEKLKVEDITTAIETGWKMLGVDPLPKLNFHRDTKLLIVVGRREQLALVDDALRELTAGPKEPKNKPTRSAPPPPSQ